MCVLAHSSFFDLGERADSLNLVSKLLLNENPASMLPTALFVLEPVLITPWHDLAAWFQNDESTAFGTMHGVRFWEYLGRDSWQNDLFNKSLAGDTRLISSVLIDKAGESIFEGIDTLVDVGGGTGAMACAIVNRFPRINCTVLDLPHVVTGLSGGMNPWFVPGDMFEEIPPADGILHKSILHDWEDEESVKKLKRCKEAMAKSSHGGKTVSIIDTVAAVRMRREQRRQPHSSVLTR
ncbi:hypothetical protein MLD38_030562 [Melastoma candidum]|uniref:Uncharacterized protein n=1 Tax=Melastoma candidum TaxID=119954 RepID=A0ACB9MM56_9MYRT|nr:hypothetical protein MLD38_030562 [Melastoma candidum]